MLGGFKNLYQAIVGVITPIKEAFREVFPPATAKSLIDFSRGFNRLTHAMIPSEKTAEKIKSIFTVLFSVLKVGVNVVKSIANLFGSLVKLVLPLGGTALNVLGSASEALNGMASAASTLSDKLKSLAGGLIEKSIIGIGKAFAFIGEGLSKLNLAKVGGLLAGGGIFAVGMKASKFIGTLIDKLEKLSDLFSKDGGGGGLKDNIKETFETLTKTLTQFQTSLKVGQLLVIAVSLGVLAASCSTLADIPAKKLATAVGAIGGLFVELGVASRLMGGANTKGLISMSIAISLLARAVKTLSEVESMGKGLLGVGALLGELTAFCIVFDKMKLKPKALNKTATGLILMAVAINLLAKPVKELGALDTGQLVKGLTALAVMLGEFTLTALAFSKIKTGGIGKAGVAMVLMAASIRLLAKPLTQLGSMDLGSLAKGLGAMGGALLELAAFTTVMSIISASTGNIMKVSAALLVMSVGIKMMATSISQMGADSGAGQGLSVMFGALVILAGAMALMQNSLAGAAAMIVVAGALAVMAPAIALLSSLNFTGVVTGLVALAGTLAVFGVGAALLTPVIPLMIALAGAMTLLGVGVLGLGAGMTMLVAAFSMATGPIIEGATAISQAFPIIAKGVGQGLVSIIKTIGESADAIKTSFVQVIEAALDALYEIGPRLVEAGLFLLGQLLLGIDRNIEQITTLAINIVIKFINGISSKMPDLVDTGFNLITSFMNSLADAIARSGDALSSAL